MSKPRFSSRLHARFHLNRVSATLVALSLAGFLVFFAAANEIKRRCPIDQFSSGEWQVRHQLEQPGHVGNGGSNLRALDHSIQRRESLHECD